MSTLEKNLTDLRSCAEAIDEKEIINSDVRLKQRTVQKNNSVAPQ